jgi:arylsulfatase A-like enzyme
MIKATTRFAVLCLFSFALSARAAEPHIIFVMADDMGWGETGYYNHPVLKTPNLDAMAANGLRLDRFYAGAPVCSPTRASVLTGRANDRTGVLSHGYALRPQERTIAQALARAGYVTGHFGKWHLNGLQGPGAPILLTDERRPGVFGFQEWLSTSNFFDINPLLSRSGKIEEFTGDSSEIAVREACTFLERHWQGSKPMFAVIWFGSPHSPFRASNEDMASFSSLSEASQNHYGELTALDRSVGTLRKKLRDLGISDNTLLVFCSDNGGLRAISPETVGGLRGNKGTLYEGGLRVPAIMEWPAVIKPRVTKYPASTMDLFPTVADIVGLPKTALLRPVDGISLKPLLEKEIGGRRRAIPFRYLGKAALRNNRYKLLSTNLADGKFELFDLETDPGETEDLSTSLPAVAQRMQKNLLAWSRSVDDSFAGKDYLEGQVKPADPEPVFWFDHPSYKSYTAEWSRRPEYKSVMERAGGNKGRKGTGKNRMPEEDDSSEDN